MTLFRYIIFIFLTICTTFVFGQKVDKVASELVGKWVMSSHVLPKNDVALSQFNTGDLISYEFKSDGSYYHVWAATYQGKRDSIVTVGKWSISKNGKIIQTSDNSFIPHQDNVLCGNYQLPIVKLNEQVFITKEHMYTEGKPGKSYYVKQ
jgi:hypothetical protein